MYSIDDLLCFDYEGYATRVDIGDNLFQDSRRAGGARIAYRAIA